MRMRGLRFAGGAFVAALATCLTGSACLAQTPRITFIGGGDKAVQGAIKINPKVAIPAYHLTFFTAQQGTSVASIEARARLTTVLTGVEPALMKRLANEAHADLKTRLAAAGVTVVDDETARSAVVGLVALPGNMEIQPISSGITVGGSVRKAWASFGADAAPALEAFNNPTSNPAKQMGIIGANRVVTQGSRRIAATVLMPHLVFDFVDTSTSSGRGLLGGATAGVGANVVFSLRANSTTNFISTIPAGPAVGAGGALSTGKDFADPTPFATLATGEAAVRALSIGPTDGLGNSNTRGDAVVADAAVWERLVRQTFQAYNAAVVAAVTKAKV